MLAYLTTRSSRLTSAATGRQTIGVRGATILHHRRICRSTPKLAPLSQIPSIRSGGRDRRAAAARERLRHILDGRGSGPLQQRATNRTVTVPRRAHVDAASRRYPSGRTSSMRALASSRPWCSPPRSLRTVLISPASRRGATAQREEREDYTRSAASVARRPRPHRRAPSRRDAHRTGPRRSAQFAPNR